MQGILDQLSRMGINFDNEILGLMMLASLPQSWKTLKISLTNFAPNGVVNIEFVKSGILNEEIETKTKGFLFITVRYLCYRFQGEKQDSRFKAKR